jgi:hypothetical protein
MTRPSLKAGLVMRMLGTRMFMSRAQYASRNARALGEYGAAVCAGQ